MRITVLILLSLFAASLQAADLPAPFLDKWSIPSDLMLVHPVPVRLISTLTHDQLAKTPTWQEGSEYPPLSPRKAEEIALKMLLKIAGERHWTQPDISLRAFDVTQGGSSHREIRWFYVLHFSLSLPMMDFETGSLNIIVLMDGTAIEPQTLEYKSIKRYDYPGLNNTNWSTMYAFPWETQLHLFEQQGWSVDSVTFSTNASETHAAIITMKRLQKLPEQKSPPDN
jgi:hypothetical protein